MNYPFVFYVDTLPPNVGATANGPIIRVLKKYKDDEGIHRHEMEHVHQWFTGMLGGLAMAYVLMIAEVQYWHLAAIVGLAFHPILYSLFPKYRLWSEVEAYKEQNRHYDDDRAPMFAGFISQNYKLNITQAEALARLTR